MTINSAAADRRSQDASNCLWENWQNGHRIPALPDAIRPRSRDEGYQIQALLEARSPKPLRGWKIAATSEHGQAHIGVDGPIAGRLLAERFFDDGAQLRFGANHMQVAEPEFAFRMARDLPPRDRAYEVDEILASVESLHPAIEVPDSRYDDFATVGAPQLIADNACAHEFVLGPAAPDNWRTNDLVSHKVSIRVPDKVEHQGDGSNVLGDPRIALAWLVKELSALGITLAAGQVVTTGTCATPLPVAPGDSVTADFGSLGKVGLTFWPE